MSKPKAIIIGRHTNTPDFPLEVVASKSVTFATSKQECIAQVEALLKEAHEAGAALIFQAVPGVLAAALTNIAVHNVPTHVGVGVIISKPAPREVGAQYTFDGELFNRTYGEDAYYGEVERLAKHCNPNAKIDGFTVTVDPPMKFEFSHIEWLF